MKPQILKITILCLLLLFSCKEGSSPKSTEYKPNYLQNREPLHPNAYLELPLGNIKPKGWLKDQLQRMATGMTGNLDSIYPEVVGDRNGWLGGDGDGWERGPYWIDGLLPLAYILDDENLKAKAQKWIDWTIENQAEDGYLGPVPFDKKPTYEPGLQRGNRKDWWPKMVMLKILQQYYNATQDQRAIETLTKYFKYQLRELPNRPLGNSTFWGNRRGSDNLMVVYWLYNITGDEFLLELGDIIQEQTFPWTTVFTNPTFENDSVSPYKFFKIKSYPHDPEQIKNLRLSQIGTMHTVNLAQGIKEPIVHYQREPDPKYIEAVKSGLQKIKQYHGQPQGMYGGDEPLHGKNPLQGVEFCSISEGMFSLETIVKITGDTEFADLLERIAYNALPTQASDDFTSRQYFQAPNQVVLSDKLDASYETKGHKGTDFVFGTLTGYPCCTTNMHQSWPKFVQNLFYATPDGGAAALLYAPATATMKVADSVNLTIEETTGFPFDEAVNFKFKLDRPARFPFHLRIPSWAKGTEIKINGETADFKIENNIAILDRTWNSKDEISLTLPMEIKSATWYANTATIERGPLVYALKIGAEERKKNRNDGYREFSEFYPTSPWNYGLPLSALKNLSDSIEVVKNEWKGNYPWNLDNAPIALKMKAYRLPKWKLVKDAPEISERLIEDLKKPESLHLEEVTLIPYGCTTLRISEFPVVEE